MSYPSLVSSVCPAHPACPRETILSHSFRPLHPPSSILGPGFKLPGKTTRFLPSFLRRVGPCKPRGSAPLPSTLLHLFGKQLIPHNDSLRYLVPSSLNVTPILHSLRKLYYQRGSSFHKYTCSPLHQFCFTNLNFRALFHSGW